MPALVVVFPSIRAGLGSSVMGLNVSLTRESPAKGETWELTVPPIPAAVVLVYS
jgi:hypothetical protein